ncbi:MAG: N-acetyltransferase [Rhabdochlamydiaceae bacterium]
MSVLPILSKVTTQHDSENIYRLIQERSNILNELASKVANPEIVPFLKETFLSTDIHVPILRGHYALHHRLAVITDEMKNDPELKITWEVFLRSLTGITITYDADGTTIEFDVTEEINRLNGNIPPFEVEFLDPKSVHFQQDLDQIFIEERECCGISRQYTREQLQETLSRPDYMCCIARRKNPSDPVGQILGHAYAKIEPTDDNQINLHGCGFGRRAFASKLGVGKRIFEGFASQKLLSYNKIFLEVRESNRPAIALYEKMGFVYEKTVVNVYPKPTENAVFMVLDPNRLAHLLAKQDST